MAQASISRRISFTITLLVSLAILLGATVFSESAFAFPSPIALDTPGDGSAPLVAYDAVSNITYVAWADSSTGVELCIFPSGATSCEGGAPVLLLDASYPGISESNTLGLGGLNILPNGDVVVIGTPVSTGSVAWESEPGGSAFFTSGQGLQNGGHFISPVSLFRAFGNTVSLDDNDVALLDDYDNYFSDSPFSSSSPSISSPNSNIGGQYPRKSLWTDGPEIGAIAAPPPAASGTDIVVAVGDNYASGSTIPGCLNYSATGYGISVGSVDGTSKAHGTLNGEGLPNYSLLTCSAEAPVLASGAGGLGVLEEEGSGPSGAGSDWQIDYRPFNATATGGSFGSPVELQDTTSEVLDGVSTLDVSEDNGGGVYGTWTDLHGLEFDYSSTNGATWGGATLAPALTGGYGNQVVSGVGGGNAVIAYTSNSGNGTQVFLLPVNYAALVADNTPAPVAAPTTLSTSQTAGTAAGGSISVPAGTVGETDHAFLSGTNAASATGTVAYTLYSSSSCSSASKVAYSVVSVSAGSASSSAAISSVLAPGTYYWEAAYSGDASNLPSSSSCGSEVLKVTPPVALPGTGSSTSSTITISITCAITPCTITVTVTVPTAGVSRFTAKKTKPLVLSSGKFILRKKGPNKLTLHLTKAGKRLLAKDHGHLKALLAVIDKTAGGVITTHTITITPTKRRHH